MTYQQAQTYLLGTISETLSPRTSYKLDRMYALLKALGDPHLRYPTIHVGGTSGKGSTCTMIAGALSAAGHRTALHTKPHLQSMTERARIDGIPISEKRFAELLDEMMPAIEATTAGDFGRPTYYETLLALAFLYFARENVDVAVIEVGLGGRLDGTNVVRPEVCAITSIGFDHTDVLGDTLEAIALEKAGIAKPGVPLLVGDVPEAAFGAIERTARAAGTTATRVRDAVRVERHDSSASGQSFDLATAAARYRIETRLAGEFQRANAAVAIAVLERLREGLRPGIEAVERGFSMLAIPGRMEILAGRPTVVFDIAHNAEKAEHLVASLRETFPRRRVHFVIAIGESKEASDILARFATLPATFALTSFEVPGRHAIDPRRLSAMLENLGGWGRAIRDPVEALSVARRNAGSEDVVVVTGSTFVVATLREWWMENVAASVS